MNERIAIGICVLSAILGVAATRANFNLANVILAVSLTWTITARWLSRQPLLLRKSIREIYQMARHSGLRDSRIASVISWGGLVLFVAFIVALFHQ